MRKFPTRDRIMTIAKARTLKTVEANGSLTTIWFPSGRGTVALLFVQFEDPFDTSGNKENDSANAWMAKLIITARKTTFKQRSRHNFFPSYYLNSC